MGRSIPDEQGGFQYAADTRWEVARRAGEESLRLYGSNSLDNPPLSPTRENVYKPENAVVWMLAYLPGEDPASAGNEGLP